MHETTKAGRAIITGGPGSGKTQEIVELALASSREGYTVILVADEDRRRDVQTRLLESESLKEARGGKIKRIGVWTFRRWQQAPYNLEEPVAIFIDGLDEWLDFYFDGLAKVYTVNLMEPWRIVNLEEKQDVDSG